VQEVRVQAIDAGRQLGGKHQRLAEAADAIGRGVAAQVAEPERTQRLARADFPPGAQHPQWLEQEIFGQVKHRRTDLIVHCVPARVGRTAQRDDQDLQAAALERRDFLCDERLGEPRVPF
jgi:hypothetical protein